MPRYFFHLRSENLLLGDREGMELPNLDAALEQVLRAKSELAADPGGCPDDVAFEVADSGGASSLL